MTTLSTARRLLFAGTVALSVALPLLACSGLPTTTDTTTPVPVPPPAPDPLKKMVGTWKILPEEAHLRELRVIDAALSGKAQKLEKLGDLTADEKKLFDEWKDKSGDAVKDMKAQLRFIRNCTFDFTDTQVTIHFGEDETYGPVSYTVASSTDSNTTLTFDPGLGNGMETHSIAWESESKGTDSITAAGKSFDPLVVVKK